MRLRWLPYRKPVLEWGLTDESERDIFRLVTVNGKGGYDVKRLVPQVGHVARQAVTFASDPTLDGAKQIAERDYLESRAR